MKHAAFLVAVLIASSLAFADPPVGTPPGGMRGGPSAEHLAQELGLNESQQAEVQRILDAQRAKMNAERAQAESSGQRPSHEEMRARRDQADAELRQQLANVLTAEQLAKFETLRKRRPPGPPQGQAGQEASREH